MTKPGAAASQSVRSAIAMPLRGRKGTQGSSRYSILALR